MLSGLLRYYKKVTATSEKDYPSSIGFLLPVVITLSMGISTISIVSLQTVTNGSANLNSQYFNSLAREAAQAGLSAAKACITANQKSWTNSTPLKPDTNCFGLTVNGKKSTVADDTTFSSTYSVAALQNLNASTTVITSTGTSSIKTTNGISITTSSVTVRTIVRTSVAPTGDSSKTISQVSTNGSTTCSVAEGWVYCWGDNTDKELGVGNTSLSNNRSAVPLAVANGALVNADSTKKVVVKVSVGKNHVCVIAKDSASDTTGNTRKAYCWGSNSSRQLGTTNASTSSSPVAVYAGAGQGSIPRSGLYNKAVTDITAGDEFTCALTSDGLVSCWGKNSSGQLGNGDTTDRNTPISIAYDSASALYNKRVMSLARVNKSSTMCAIDTAYKAYCWGDNTVGQVGDGNHASGNTNSSSVFVTVGGGQVNTACQFYPDTSTTSPMSKTGALSITKPTAVSSGTNFTSIDIYNDSVTAISYATNRAYFWGGGDATTTTSTTCTVNRCVRNGVATSRYCREVRTDTTTAYTANLPTGPRYNSASGTDFNRKSLSLATGNVYDGLFCAQAGGLLYCDGHGKFTTYQGLGDNNTCTSSCPTPTTPVPVFLKTATSNGWLTGKTITGLATGGNVTCVIADNAVGCWGANRKSVV